MPSGEPLLENETGDARSRALGQQAARQVDDRLHVREAGRRLVLARCPGDVRDPHLVTPDARVREPSGHGALTLLRQVDAEGERPPNGAVPQLIPGRLVVALRHDGQAPRRSSDASASPAVASHPIRARHLLVTDRVTAAREPVDRVRRECSDLPLTGCEVEPRLAHQSTGHRLLDHVGLAPRSESPRVDDQLTAAIGHGSRDPIPAQEDVGQGAVDVQVRITSAGGDLGGDEACPPVSLEDAYVLAVTAVTGGAEAGLSHQPRQRPGGRRLHHVEPLVAQRRVAADGIQRERLRQRQRELVSSVAHGLAAVSSAGRL